MTRPVGVVLAAGVGSRMGGPKALLRYPFPPYDGTEAATAPSLAAVHARALLRAGCCRVLVVTRQLMAMELAGELPAGARTVVSREADALGPAGSLRAALGHLTNSDGYAVITPVDAVPVGARCYGALLAALAHGPAAVTPRYRGRGGHPVVVACAELRRFRATPTPTLRDVLRELRPRTTQVFVHDWRIRRDLDTPAHWSRLAADLGLSEAPPKHFAGAAQKTGNSLSG